MISGKCIAPIIFYLMEIYMRPVSKAVDTLLPHHNDVDIFPVQVFSQISPIFKSLTTIFPLVRYNMITHLFVQ